MQICGKLLTIPVPYWDSCKGHLHQITPELFIFEMCTDPLLSPKGRNVTFVHISRKIFLRSVLTGKEKAVLWGLIHNSLFISSFLTVITSCLHSSRKTNRKAIPLLHQPIGLFSAIEFKLIIQFVFMNSVVLLLLVHISRTMSFLAQ